MFPVTSFPRICYRTEDYHCVSVSYLFGSPLSWRISVYEWPRLSVTLTVPPHMNESTYKIFILLSMKVSACIVTAIQMALTNSSVWSQFPSNGSGSAALALWVGFCEVWTGILAWGFIAIACATVDAVAEATLVISSCVSATQVWRKAFNSLSCCSCSC